MLRELRGQLETGAIAGTRPLLERLVESIGYRQYLQRAYGGPAAAADGEDNGDVESRWDNVLELMRFASEMDEQIRQEVRPAPAPAPAPCGGGS